VWVQQLLKHKQSLWYFRSAPTDTNTNAIDDCPRPYGEGHRIHEPRYVQFKAKDVHSFFTPTNGLTGDIYVSLACIMRLGQWTNNVQVHQPSVGGMAEEQQ
jgi:hypothetical protein